MAITVITHRNASGQASLGDVFATATFFKSDEHGRLFIFESHRSDAKALGAYPAGTWFGLIVDGTGVETSLKETATVVPQRIR